MKGGMRVFEMITPFTSPIKTATPNANKIPGSRPICGIMLVVCVVVVPPIMMAERITTPPTVKSIPPVNMQSVCPMATTPMIDVWKRTLIILLGWMDMPFDIIAPTKRMPIKIRSIVFATANDLNLGNKLFDDLDVVVLVVIF